MQCKNQVYGKRKYGLSNQTKQDNFKGGSLHWHTLNDISLTRNEKPTMKTK